LESLPPQNTPDHSQNSIDSLQCPSPDIQPVQNQRKLSFIQRCPLTLGFVFLVSLIYGISTFSNGFQYPDKAFILLGGFYPPFVQNGEWWRYISASLLHGTPAHWVNNIAGLLIFGNLLEPILGFWPLAGIYFISAFSGLWLSSVMLPNAMTYGASTIDYGLIGAYITLILLIRLNLDKKAFFRELRGSVLLVLMFIVWNAMESATVNLWGHLGGLAGGLLCMLTFWMVGNKGVSLPKG
jgi:rhomboid protease GluP